MKQKRDRRLKKEKNPHRIRLTLMYSLVVFFMLFITILLAALIVFILSKTGLIVDSTDYNTNYIIIYMSTISLIVGALVSLLTSNVPLNPFKRIITQLNSLASGDYKVRLRFGSLLRNQPSFKELSDSFNTLAEELENTELLRSDFINNFSHEFKTPIVSIAGFAKLLKKGNLSEEQRQEYIQIIEEESLRLSYMATNVLNLSKVENQTILTEVSTYNLSEQLRYCVLLLENRWIKKNLEFQLEFKEYEVEANEELMKQVWLNLLDNAIKFTPMQGTITIQVYPKQEGVTVSVSNEGSEIPKEQLTKVFNKFFQGDESHASEGNGVGLAIVKRVVELHQGTVDVQSECNSTTFYVTIPVKR